MMSIPEGRTNKNRIVFIIGRFDAVNAAQYFAENTRGITLLSVSANRQLPSHWRTFERTLLIYDYSVVYIIDRLSNCFIDRVNDLFDPWLLNWLINWLIDALSGWFGAMFTLPSVRTSVRACVRACCAWLLTEASLVLLGALPDLGRLAAGRHGGQTHVVVDVAHGSDQLLGAAGLPLALQKPLGPPLLHWEKKTPFCT